MFRRLIPASRLLNGLANAADRLADLWPGRWLLARSLQALRWGAALVLAVWSIALIAWLTLHWGILPHINDWRPEVEQRASQALGLPLRIGRIEAPSQGWLPTLELRDVVLADRDGREALRLPRVSAALSWQTLFTLRLRFAQLYVEGLEVEVRRDAQGRLHVAGLDMSAAAPLDEEGAGLDWLLAQPEFVLRHGTLRWVDQRRGAPPLELRDASLLLRNGLRRHDLRLDATPPEGWGQRFSIVGRFTQPLLARAGHWQRWAGTLYAELPAADAARLRDHVSLPFDLRAGTGSARVWLDLAKGQWRRVTLDAALDNVELRLADGLEPLALGRAQGRVEAERSATSLRLSAQGLRFTTADGADWPASRFSLLLNQPQAMNQPGLSTAPVAGGDFNADRLDLGLMAAIAGRLPLPAPMRQGLAELAPTGLVQGLQASWTGPPEAPVHYRVKGRVNGLSIAALPAPEPAQVGRPGWRGADLDIDASETGGEARLQLRNGALELPGVFEDPLLPLDQFSSRLVWQVTPASAGRAPAPPAIDLRLIDGQFANADAHGDLQLHWHTGAGAGHGKGGRYPGVIDLTGHIDQGQATSVARYLPRGLTHTRDYLAGAIQSGGVRQARVRLRGDLQEFPFAHLANPRDGEFHVSAQADNLSFSYVPPVLTGGVARWPEFTQVNGELVFDRGAMRIKDARARLWGIELKGVNGQIADLAHEPTLVIDGSGHGPLADGLRYVGATPIDGWTAHALRDATGTGAVDFKLGLQIPLNDAAHTQVKGTVLLAGNDVRLRPDVPLLAAAKAKVEFSEHGFSVTGGNARALGGELAFEGGQGADGGVRFSGQGTASAEGLRQASELGALPRLAASMSGQAPYKLQLGFPRGQTELLVTSPLTGLALDLPAPLKKSAETSWPLRVQLQPQAAAEGLPRDALRVELGPVLKAEFQRELSPEGARVLRGQLALGDAAAGALPALPATGVAASVQAAQWPADAWWALAKAWQADPRAGTAADAGYLPNELAFRTSALTLAGRRLGALAVNLQRRPAADGELWRAQLVGDAVQGQVDYRPGVSGVPWPRWQARLTRLAVPAAEPPPGATPSSAPADPLADGLTNPGTPPALDLVVDELEWKGRKFGRLELDGRPADTAGPGGARDWRLQKLSAGSTEARLSGSGQWAAGTRRMALDLKLDVADGGAMLERLGLGKQLRGGKGHAQGQLAWTGSPLWPDWGSLGGSAQLNLDAGQFLKAEPGAARLLGVLSLQSLPRRLTLDFRDVFQQGFAFDNMSADIALADGVARSNNLRIRGVQAAVLIEGQADLKRETQDLHMVVVPEINAGTASLAYAAINPAIGLGTFLAQLFLRKPLMQAGTREFHVGGTWADPQVDPIERANDAALPDMDSPAASASNPVSGR